MTYNKCKNLEFVLSESKDYYILDRGMKCNEKIIVIPSEYEGLPVKEINSYCFFQNHYVEEIVIGDKVEIISDFAFNSCVNLKNIKLPCNLKEICEHAFHSCKNLEELYIPSEVQKIESNAFDGCESLNQVVVSGENMFYKSIDSSIYSKDGKILIKYINSGEDVYEIPDSVITIKNYALKECDIEHLVIGKNVAILEEYAISDCSFLRWISTHHDNINFTSIQGVLYTKDLKKIIKYPCVKNAIEYKILSESEIIGNNAFENCLSLEEIIMDDNIKIIERAAFNGCRNLICIRLSQNLEVIGTETFSECCQLNPIIIPKSVKYIGDAAFYCICDKTIIFEHDITFKKYLDENCPGWDYNEDITSIKINQFKVVFEGK